MVKKLRVIECIGVKQWYDQARVEKKFDNLTVSTLWALRKNIKPIIDIVNNFNDFKSGLEEELQAEYFTEEKSQVVTIKNQNGQDVPARKVKDEFLPEYQEKVIEINEKLKEIVDNIEQFSFSAIDINKEIERLGSSCVLNMDDLDILSIFEEDGQND